MGSATTRSLALLAAFLSMAVVMVVKTFADTAFLAEYGVDYVPHFFVAQALAMVSTAALYGRVIKKRSWIAADALILAGTAGLAFAGPAAVAAGGAAVFAITLALIALAALTALATWNAASSIIAGRAARSFIPRLGAAATVGAALGGFGSSGIVASFGVDALAPTAGALASGLLALQILLMRRARIDDTRHKSTRRPISKPARAPLARRLVTMLIAAAICEALLSAFIDYGFKREVAASFSRDDMGLFFALFYGGGNVALLVLQVFVATRLLTSKSLRFSLSLEPAALLVAAAMWALFPVLAVAALGRGVEMIGKFGVARPAQEVALAPLHASTRQRWKVLLRGVFNQGAQAAGGLLLILGAPLLERSLAVVPACIMALAMGWLLVQRRVAACYLDTLGSELGMLGLSVRATRGEFRLDRDGLKHVIELIADDDPDISRFGRELLLNAVDDPSVLAPHLSHSSPKVRRAVYHILTRLPSRACLASLRAAVRREVDDRALATGLRALGAHKDGAVVEQARLLVDESAGRSMVEIADPVAAALIQAAWSYLAEVGALDSDPDLLRTVLDDMLSCDGATVAALYRRAIQNRRIGGDAVDQTILGAIDSPDRERRRQALCAAAALGRIRPLKRLLDAIEVNTPGADAALAQLDSKAMLRLGKLAHGSASPRARGRLVRALGACSVPETVDVVAPFLRDDSPAVREMAAHTLLKLTRDGEHEPPRELIDAALRDELDRFELYIAARPGYGDRSDRAVTFRHGTATEPDARTFFLDELERRTERALTRVCSVLALQGNPAKVHAAERALRAPTVNNRRHGVDILQEVARGPHRARLFELLDAYLQPRDRGDSARDRACEHDPWLARCRSNADPDLRRRLWGLRATVLFDSADGEALAALAAHVDELNVAESDTIVTQGEPGDALFVLMHGTLSVRRDGEPLATLSPGQCFGELALIDGKPRDATVVALERAQMLRLPRAPFREALVEQSEIGLGLVRGLARWLRQSYED